MFNSISLFLGRSDLNQQLVVFSFLFCSDLRVSIGLPFVSSNMRNINSEPIIQLIAKIIMHPYRSTFSSNKGNSFVHVNDVMFRAKMQIAKPTVRIWKQKSKIHLRLQKIPNSKVNRN